MANLASREDFKQYCLRSLGSPVLEINVDDQQLEDKIDEALEYWRLYHPEGTEQVYAKYKITASSINIVESIADTFTTGEKIIGTQSHTTAIIVKEPLGRSSTGTTLIVADIVGTFIDGETVTGQISQHTATLTNILDHPAVITGIYDNRYVTLPDLMYGVTRVIPMAQASSSKNMFDLQYQLRLHDLYDVTSTSMIYYKTVMQHLDMLDFELNAKPDIRFNRFTNQLYLDITWKIDTTIGDYILVDGYGAMDPNVYHRIWNELWLKHYCVALFKKQWGYNLKKFSGIQLQGGVTLDGQNLYDEAVGEIKDLEEELMLKSAPCQWFMG